MIERIPTLEPVSTDRNCVMMSEAMEAVEAARARFRPKRITTLFVGESAPASGDFFYYGNTAMFRHMQRAVEHAIGEGGDFLKRFKTYGWYLDDLVLTPVNHLTKSQRTAKCLDAQNSLAHRIVEYRPLAIVSLLLTIKNVVNAAADHADNNAPRYAVPFPGMGQQVRFHTAMASIIPKLPRLEHDPRLISGLLGCIGRAAGRHLRRRERIEVEIGKSGIP